MPRNTVSRSSSEAANSERLCGEKITRSTWLRLQKCHSVTLTWSGYCPRFTRYSEWTEDTPSTLTDVLDSRWVLSSSARNPFEKKNKKSFTSWKERLCGNDIEAQDDSNSFVCMRFHSVSLWIQRCTSARHQWVSRK